MYYQTNDILWMIFEVKGTQFRSFISSDNNQKMKETIFDQLNIFCTQFRLDQRQNQFRRQIQIYVFFPVSVINNFCFILSIFVDERKINYFCFTKKRKKKKKEKETRELKMLLFISDSCLEKYLTFNYCLLECAWSF